MNTLTQAITIDWINSIGWTLLHSLWQGLAVFLLVIVVLRLMPALRSPVRYAIAFGGLLLMTAISVATFAHFAGAPVNHTVAPSSVIRHAVYFPEVATQQHGQLPWISMLEQNMHMIVLLWAIGFIVSALRWATGLYHTYRIRSGAQLVEGEWLAYVQRTATALDIPRTVKIAESIAINAPVVLGYFKPLILIPAGMIAGLSTQQIETIFLHELAHIRRHDYLMNVFQTVIESIFFFNPFVRMLSNEVRREREYCCDDMVISIHGNNSAYVHALVRLAEARLATPAFALSLAGNKNQLLSRIQRIMERTAKQSSGKSRLIIPVLLVFAGALASISWISADREKKNYGAALSAADTVPDKERSSARFYRRSIISIDENGQPHEEVIQEFEGDEEFRALLEGNLGIFDDSAFRNDFHGSFPGHFPDGVVTPSWRDTLPHFDSKEWQEFAKAFDERFENLFQADADARKFMEAFKENFRWDDWATPFDHHRFDSLGKLRNGDVFKNFREEFEKFENLSPEGLEYLKKEFRPFGNPIQNFDQALRERLIEDGYLSPDENIESLQWSDDSFKVNGKNLEPEDVKKYNDLRKGILESDDPVRLE